MSRIRIIAGQFGGRMIDAPKNERTHPMSERARGAIFNSLSVDIPEAEVLDAFAGTGALGLEALSRGAKSATFIEKDRVASNIISENIAALGVESTTKNIRASLSSWIDSTDNNKRYDLIFADPPYHDEQFSTVTKLFGLLKPGGTMVLSHSGRGEVPTRHGIVVVDNRCYANAHLTIFHREDA